MQEKQCAASEAVISTTTASVELLSPGSASANEESEYDSGINVNCANKCKSLKTILSEKVLSTLQHQLNYIEIAEGIKLAYCLMKSVSHFDGKLLPNMSDKETLVDMLLVLLFLLAHGTTKLLGVPALGTVWDRLYR